MRWCKSWIHILPWVQVEGDVFGALSRSQNFGARDVQNTQLKAENSGGVHLKIGKSVEVLVGCQKRGVHQSETDYFRVGDILYCVPQSKVSIPYFPISF